MRSFAQQENQLRKGLIEAQAFSRGEWQSQKLTEPLKFTKEVMHAQIIFQVPESRADLQELVKPNLSWAEDHFGERVGGEPLNPPPSNEWWPHAQAGNTEFKAQDKFSHTYPERYWPKFANVGGETDQGRQIFVPHVGIRYEYGDLHDLITVLVNNPLSRQAYLPVWFPEDLTAATSQQRVPCTLGYHFLMAPDGKLDITYHMRSCDFVRHFRDDVYMACRLLQWVTFHINSPEFLGPEDEPWKVGRLVMNMSSLHCFQGDLGKLKMDAKEADQQIEFNWAANL